MPPKKNQPVKPKNNNVVKKNSKKQIGGDNPESSDSDDFLESDSEEIDEIEENDENDEEENEDDKESENHESDEDEDEDVEVDDDGDDDCVYKVSGNKKNKIDMDDDYEIDGDDIYFEEDEKLIQNVFVTNDKRVTKPTLTKYERVRLLGERAKQISLGAKPMIKNVQGMGPKEIAQLELEYGVIPIFIIRTLPTGQKERWKINELKISN